MRISRRPTAARARAGCSPKVMLPRLGLRLHGGLAPRRSVELAIAAEAAGFANLWFAENPFQRGILPAAAACAVATRRIGIGAGVFNPYSRHPSLAAMEIAALDELADGRATLGIGSGIGFAVERMGYTYDRPLTTVREAVRIIRALLAGETVDFAGEVFRVKGVRLEFAARADLSIYLAARGPRAIDACAELADGMIVSNLCTREFVARAVARLGSRRVRVVQYLPAFVQADRREARRAAKRAIGAMLPGYWRLGARLPDAKAALLAGSGFDDAEIAGAVARLGAGEAAEAVLDERFVDAYALAGDAEDCVAQAAAYAAAGVDELALSLGSLAEIALLGARAIDRPT